MTHRPSTTRGLRTRTTRTAAWLALFAVAALVALPALHFAPRNAAALVTPADAPATPSLSAPEAIRSHLSCPVCLALAQARGAAIHASGATPALAGAAPSPACACAELPPAAPDLDDQRPRAPPVPA